MKKTILSAAALLALGIGATSVPAEVIQQQTTETTYSGTVSTVVPNSSIVVKSVTGPAQTYTINKQTTFVDQNGNVVSYEQVQGRPVQVYVAQAQPTVVERVVVTESVPPPPPAPRVIERHETETRTYHEE